MIVFYWYSERHLSRFPDTIATLRQPKLENRQFNKYRTQSTEQRIIIDAQNHITANQILLDPSIILATHHFQ